MDDWDVDSEGLYGANGNDTIIAGLILENFEETDSGVGAPVLSDVTEPTAASERPRLLSRWITDLSNEPIALIQPIPVIVEEHAPCEYTARFREANIAMSGESIQEATQRLLADILNCYEDLTEEPIEMLGAGPREQLQILRMYLRENAK